MSLPDCSCGYFDASQNRLWTDSIIVYFNESSTVPDSIFRIQDYTNAAEKAWNAYYRQGATPANVAVANTTYSDRTTNSSLQLFVNPATADHTVVGGGIETLRKDIKYGSFRTWMRSPQRYPKGTSLSMQMRYNTTQGLQLNMQNTNDPSTAWVSNLMADDFAERKLGVNYTVMANTSLENATPDPWSYYEQRIEWNSDNITFWAGNNVTRAITRKASHYFDTPSSFEIKHWSIGDEYAMDGPPLKGQVVANVGWLRAFFNTSSMSTTARGAFDARCHLSDACNVDDFTLRNATSFPPSALNTWHASRTEWSAVWPAIVIAAFCLCFTIIVFLNALFRRFILERGQSQAQGQSHASPIYQNNERDSQEYPTKEPYIVEQKNKSGETMSLEESLANKGSSSGDSTHHGSRSSDRDTGSEPGTLVFPTPAHTRPSSLRNGNPCGCGAAWQSMSTSHECAADTAELRFDGPISYSLEGEKVQARDMAFPSAVHTKYQKPDDVIEVLPKTITNAKGKAHETITSVVEISDQRKADQPEKAANTPVSDGKKGSAPPAPRQRIDYLAGLVAVCSLLVTAIHFTLTFVPGLVFPDGFVHYPSETWARKIIGPYVFNQVWVGLFFATSTRFLVMKYLKTGNLVSIAEKVVCRVPRLFVPIGAIVLLEYFLIDCGAITYLQYLPSVTWSTWPYTVEFRNFGIFINEFLELIYLVPNAVPRIVFNYCIGVLWTIPVQLQGTWQALLGAIVVVECKQPSKRFFYYSINILYNWYTQDWGAFFYFGLMLTDLDVVFKYRDWLYARPKVYYPTLIFFSLVGIAGLTNDLISAWMPINFAAIEFNIHPDLASGLPIVQSPNNHFPAYYAPTIKHLMFCLGFQAVVELSTTVQKALSSKLLVMVFPHIFTIYLIHGFIFWSLGATVCVKFNALGLPYWANSLLTAVICYGALAVAVVFITPVMEVLGKDGAANAWRMANSKVPVVKWKPTLFPYSKATLESRPDAMDRHENATDVENSPREVREIERHIAEENANYIEEAIEDGNIQRLHVIAGLRESKLEQALSTN